MVRHVILIHSVRSLRRLDVILGMNSLEFNRVHMNYYNKTMIFHEFFEEDSRIISSNQVEEFLKDEA